MGILRFLTLMSSTNGCPSDAQTAPRSDMTVIGWQTRPRRVTQRMNLVQSYMPTPNDRDGDEVWQVVRRRDKGKNIVEGTSVDMSARVSPQCHATTGRGYVQVNQVPDRVNSPNLEGCGASSSEHVLYSITNILSVCVNRTSTVPINNSFNGLIPYMYNRRH